VAPLEREDHDLAARYAVAQPRLGTVVTRKGSRWSEQRTKRASGEGETPSATTVDRP